MKPLAGEGMMDTAQVIAGLNKAIALEHAASLQYKQHALLVRGLWRRVFTDFFSGESRNALETRPEVWAKNCRPWGGANR